jgi:flagellar biosynthesis protein FliP
MLAPALQPIRMMRRICLLIILATLLLPEVASAVPRIDVSVGGGDPTAPGQISSTLKILAALTVLSLAPAILMLMTSFTRIVIVLSFVRQSLGVQGMPPNQVMMGLALILTLFVMAPVGQRIHAESLAPYSQGKISESQAIDAGLGPLREFMLHQTRVKDLQFFLELSNAQPSRPSEVPMTVLIPAFVLSELTAAFHMGFLIYIPFLVLDFVLASVLMSMGMVMLPPALISLPLKIMLFVLVDGWHLVAASLVRSFA